MIVKHVIIQDCNRKYCVIEVPDTFDLQVEPFTVAVVGNAKSLFDKNYGVHIDSHDVVIRMNRAAQLMDISQEYIPSHGSKTDIWCMWRYSEYENVDMEWSGSSCQMCFWEEEPPRGIHLIDSLEFTKTHTYPFSPSTGLMTLAWLNTLECNVDVYGFDWKETPTYTDPERQLDQNEIHDFNLERKICEEYFQPTGRFKFWN